MTPFSEAIPLGEIFCSLISRLGFVTSNCFEPDRTTAAEEEVESIYVMSKSQKLTRRQIKDLVVVNAMRSEAYRAGLLADPKATVEKQLGQLLPEGFNVELLYEDADTMYVVLPPNFPEDEIWEEARHDEETAPTPLRACDVMQEDSRRNQEFSQHRHVALNEVEVTDVESLSEADLESIAGGFAETHVNSCLGSGSMTSNA